MSSLTEQSLLSASGRPLPRNWLAILVLVFVSQTISIITSYAAGFAMVWYITATTGSAFWLSLSTLLSMLPAGLVSPFGGIIADRFNRKWLMVWADGGVGLVSLICTLISFIWAPSIALILIIGFFRSLGQGFHTPAAQAITPLLVPDRQLVRANSFLQTVFSTAGIISPALGILLLTATNLSFCFLLDAAGALLAVLVLLFVKVPTVHDFSADHQHVGHNLLAGWRVIQSDKSLLYLVLLAVLIMILDSPISALFPLMTAQHFAGDGYMAALSESVWGALMLVGSLVMLAWGGGRRLALLIVVSSAASGLAIFLCGLLAPDQFPLFLVLCGLGAFFSAFYFGPLYTLIQRRTPVEKLGRVNGLMASASLLVSPLGLIISGLLADRTGVALFFVICGLALTLLPVLAYWTKPLRALDRPAPPVEQLAESSDQPPDAG